MDLTVLDNSVLDTWGESLQVQAGNITHTLTGVFNDAYATSPVGNTRVERPDPSFSFKQTEYNETGATVGDLIIYSDISFTIIEDPQLESGNWLNVPVRQYA